MTRYKSLCAHCGIAAFSIDDDSIDVLFHSGFACLYTYESTGAKRVEEMKRLAEQGHDLDNYIDHNRDVWESYASKRWCGGAVPV